MSLYFKELNYTLGDEDSMLEFGLLQEHVRNVVTIAGSGGRVLPLLAKRPERLICVDILPDQLSLLRLRLALLAALEYEGFLLFLGYREGMLPEARRELFASLRIADDDREILKRFFSSIDWKAPIYCGRFERMLLTLHKIARLLTGNAGRGIFDNIGLDAQCDYYRTRFPQRRWKAVIALLGNSAVLNSLLYAGDFPRNNLGITSFARYEEIFEALFTKIPVRESFFLQQIFLGAIKHEEGLPAECNPQLYSAAKSAMRDCDIRLVCSDAISCITSLSDVGFVSISDVPSFLPDERARTFLQDMRPALAPDALVVARGHMRVARPDLDAFEDVSDTHADAIAAERTGLWKVSIYRHSEK